MSEENKNEMKLPNYYTAMDHLSNLTGKLNSITNQFNFLTSLMYKTGLTSAASTIQRRLRLIPTITSQLPNISNNISR